MDCSRPHSRLRQLIGNLIDKVLVSFFLVEDLGSMFGVVNSRLLLSCCRASGRHRAVISYRQVLVPHGVRSSLKRNIMSTKAAPGTLRYGFSVNPRPVKDDINGKAACGPTQVRPKAPGVQATKARAQQDYWSWPKNVCFWLHGLHSAFQDMTLLLGLMGAI
eukprot:scaffold124075_cov26-Prasinocladus_malaysianus.AAC.2